jgi:hypothetical protein
MMLNHIRRLLGFIVSMAALTGFTNAEEAQRLEEYFQDSAKTMAATHLALFTATPGEDGTGGTEVANSNGYARLSFTRNGTNWAAASGGAPSTIANATIATFAQASGGSWGTVSHWAYVTSGTYGGGSIEFGGALDATKTVDDGDTFRFPVGNLVGKLGDPGDTY